MAKVIIKNTVSNTLSEIIGEIFERYNVRNKVLDKTVLVKPNLIGAFPPEKGATTDPRIVEVIVKELEKCNTKEIVVGDNSGSIHFDSMKIAKITGILEVSNGHFKNIAGEVEKVKVQSKFIENLYISKIVLQADYIINVPKFKTHSLTTITGAIKNMFGIIPGGKKAKLHTVTHSVDEFAELLVDIYQIRVPDLHIMDAIIGMEGMGPSNGSPREINKIIGSDNGISLDAVVAFMMGINPRLIELLQVANSRNLGEINPLNIEIDGELKKIHGFRVPKNGIVQKIIKMAVPHAFNFASVTPVVNHKKCKICKKCVEVCPVSAMKIKNKYPEVDRKKCISCFCCDEHCPYGAISLPSWQVDIFNRLIGK